MKTEIQKKGQFTIVALMTTFLMLVVYAALLPAINDTIDLLVPSLDGPTKLIVELIPFAIGAMILAGITMYGKPSYEY